MKKYSTTFLMFFVLMLITIPAHAQPAKDAIMALKKLEARVQAGISYREYGPALGEAKFPVNIFSESDDAKKYPELLDSVNKTMKHYEYAGKAWPIKFSKYSRGLVDADSQVGMEIKALYPQAEVPSILKEKGRNQYFVDSLVKMMWQAASDELKNATRLYKEIEKTHL